MTSAYSQSEACHFDRKIRVNLFSAPNSKASKTLQSAMIFDLRTNVTTMFEIQSKRIITKDMGVAVLKMKKEKPKEFDTILKQTKEGASNQLDSLKNKISDLGKKKKCHAVGRLCFNKTTRNKSLAYLEMAKQIHRSEERMIPMTYQIGVLTWRMIQGEHRKQIKKGMLISHYLPLGDEVNDSIFSFRYSFKKIDPKQYFQDPKGFSRTGKSP